jgi:hypothetical protein
MDRPIGSSPLQSCLCCAMIRVILIDRASSDEQPQDQNKAEPASVNGKEPEQQIVGKRAAEHDGNGGNDARTEENVDL